MSEESLPVPPLTMDDSRDDARGGVARRPRPATAVRPVDRQLPTAPPRLTPTVAAVAATSVGYALIAGSFRRLTVPAELSTFVAGSLLTWLALRKDCRRRPAPDHIDGKGALPWGVLLVVFGVWELYADFRGSTPDHPTLSILMGPLLEEPVNRAIGYVLWLAAGVWVVRR